MMDIHRPKNEIMPFTGYVLMALDFHHPYEFSYFNLNKIQIRIVGNCSSASFLYPTLLPNDVPLATLWTSEQLFSRCLLQCLGWMGSQ